MVFIFHTISYIICYICDSRSKRYIRPAINSGSGVYMGFIIGVKNRTKGDHLFSLGYGTCLIRVEYSTVQ